MKLVQIVLALVLISILTCCGSEKETLGPEQTYLFLGHPYDWLAENRVDPRLELLDYSQFSGLWLGGDVCARTSKEPQTLEYLDSLFQLRSPSTHWAWGNHDLIEGEAKRLTAATGRPSYYASYQEGLLLLVLNTNLYWHHPWKPAQEDCERKRVHYDWLQRVLDTVQSASHLVLLHHHGLLNEFKTNAAGDTLKLGNVDAIPVRPLCDSVRDFSSEIYPQLRRLQEKGTEVVMISGDVGMRSKGYQFTTPDGVQILGSGINNSLNMDYAPDYVVNFEPDSVLTLQYSPEERKLDWSFVRLNDLVFEQMGEGSALPSDPRIKRLLSDH